MKLFRKSNLQVKPVFTNKSQSSKKKNRRRLKTTRICRLCEWSARSWHRVSRRRERELNTRRNQTLHHRQWSAYSWLITRRTKFRLLKFNLSAVKRCKNCPRLQWIDLTLPCKLIRIIVLKEHPTLSQKYTLMSLSSLKILTLRRSKYAPQKWPITVSLSPSLPLRTRAMASLEQGQLIAEISNWIGIWTVNTRRFKNQLLSSLRECKIFSEPAGLVLPQLLSWVEQGL
jgi:hypothetical protein